MWSIRPFPLSPFWRELGVFALLVGTACVLAGPDGRRGVKCYFCNAPHAFLHCTSAAAVRTVEGHGPWALTSGHPVNKYTAVRDKVQTEPNQNGLLTFTLPVVFCPKRREEKTKLGTTTASGIVPAFSKDSLDFVLHPTLKSHNNMCQHQRRKSNRFWTGLRKQTQTPYLLLIIHGRLGLFVEYV